VQNAFRLLLNKAKIEKFMEKINKIINEKLNTEY